MINIFTLIFLSILQDSLFIPSNIGINLVLGYLFTLFFFKKKNMFLYFLTAGIMLDLTSTYHIAGHTLLLIIFFFVLNFLFESIDKNIVSFLIVSFFLLITYFSYSQLLGIIGSNIGFDINLSVSQAGFNLIYCLFSYLIFKYVFYKK